MEMKNKQYKDFPLTKVFNVSYGNKFDKNKMTYKNPSVNFVSRTAQNNGISDIVDEVNIKPFTGGQLTLALGGSIGSCFIQEKPFYTGQNVAVLEPIENISSQAKLYLTSVISKKCKTIFTAFSDEINKHLKTDLEICLPIKKEYIPDFDVIECLFGGVSVCRKLIPQLGKSFHYQHYLMHQMEM